MFYMLDRGLIVDERQVVSIQIHDDSATVRTADFVSHPCDGQFFDLLRAYVAGHVTRADYRAAVKRLLDAG